ncbi:FHA domain-containing protein [Bifidobacterium cuniculi]|uniref:PT repeat family protein n=1 Tax=Bifidobacterium cuniculi TaxID=1688 RepID=A0A087AY94_9BIFI|nr:FHA domain-containing protein [Bifidobacterium cuniculi]KFI63744.1 PT repeat family protein [Bifidobacterium cuniculi]
MSGDQQTATKWMIRVDGSDLTSVEAGQTVQIGRKPLRPVPDEGIRRIEILDDTRSMSKRHAQFSVKTTGDAILRDLGSTNGTYLVRPGNELVRLDSGSDFAMTDDTVRLQFGDVPVDFIRFIDENPQHDEQPVANLFDYAVDSAPADHDANGDMSVDDILNLRAGEPTDIFDAGHVRARASELREAEQQTFVPFVQPINPANLDDDAPRDEAAPRDLFADAHDVATGKIAEPAVKKEEFVPKQYSGPRHADHRTGDRLIRVEELARFHDPASTAMPAAQPTPAVQPVQQPQQPAASDASSAPAAGMANVVSPTVSATDSDVAVTPQDLPDAVPMSALSRQHAALQLDVLETSLATTPGAQEPVVSADHARFQRPAQEPAPLEETQAFTPAFEPGSVFERVAKGDFEPKEPLVEAGGFTSEDARRSDDFAQQFEMATHNELLPFLAMNPALYDDLYAWLAAQGDDDIDAALDRNPGYEDYRKATGK